MSKISLISLLLIWHVNSWSQEFKVMTFNTMCDFCGSEDYEPIKTRLNTIKYMVEAHSPHLLSLQEMRTASQVKFLFKDLENYKLLFWDSFLLSYPDPALAVNTDRFNILEQGQFWLGPKEGDFTLGWKYALPRQVQWAVLEDKKTQFQFLFMGSHFDNRKQNMIGSAKMVQKFIQKKNMVTIFAGDTNCTVDFKGYKVLKGKNLKNTFTDAQDKKNQLVNKKESKALCYHRKGEVFPACRVDHILYSKNSPWIIKSWETILYKNVNSKNFPSDHRAVMAIFTYPSVL